MMLLWCFDVRSKASIWNRSNCSNDFALELYLQFCTCRVGVETAAILDFCHGLRFIPDILNCIFIEIKRTSVQKSNKNEIFMARVKNSNCLKFCTQVEPSKTRRTVYIVPQICFYFREKRTFRFHPLESMDRVITGRKLNTFARFAFQRYYV